MSNIKASSFLGSAAKARDEKVKELTVELAVPTWGRQLLWGFTVIDRDWLDEYVNEQSKRTLESDIDLVVKGTDAFWFLDPDHQIEGKRLHDDPKTGRKRDDYVRIETEEGQAVKPDQALAEALEFTTVDSPGSPPPSTQLVLYLFKNNGVAVGSFATRVSMWMQNTDLDVSQNTLGE